MFLKNIPFEIVEYIFIFFEKNDILNISLALSPLKNINFFIRKNMILCLKISWRKLC